MTAIVTILLRSAPFGCNRWIRSRASEGSNGYPVHTAALCCVDAQSTQEQCHKDQPHALGVVLCRLGTRDFRSDRPEPQETEPESESDGGEDIEPTPQRLRRTTSLGDLFILPRDPRTNAFGFALLNSPAASGIRVFDVFAGSPAEVQGVYCNSVITEVNGQRVLGKRYQEILTLLDETEGDLKVRFMPRPTAVRMLKAEATAAVVQRTYRARRRAAALKREAEVADSDSGCDELVRTTSLRSTAPASSSLHPSMSVPDTSTDSSTDEDLAAQLNAQFPNLRWNPEKRTASEVLPLVGVRPCGARIRITGSKLYPGSMGTYSELAVTFNDRSVYQRATHRGIYYLYYARKAGGGQWRISRKLGGQKSKICAFSTARDPAKVQDWYESVGEKHLGLQQHQPNIKAKELKRLPPASPTDTYSRDRCTNSA
eukprot:m.366739 g.366739  ORF g.366739 m.366739 type:complete len:428 (-) comp16659_c0_seq24:124-1407(-)